LGGACGSVVVFALPEAGSAADAFTFAMSVTTAQRPAEDHAVSMADDEPDIDEAEELEAALSRQVIETWSPALKSASFETALPSTGSVRLSTVDSLVDAVVLPWPGLRTVMVLLAGSVDTTTAVSFALLFVDAEADVPVVVVLVVVVVVVLAGCDGCDGCDVRCFTSASTVLWSGFRVPPWEMLLLVVDEVLLPAGMEPPGLPADELVVVVDGLPNVEDDVVLDVVLDEGLVLLYALPGALVMAVTEAHWLSRVAVVPDAVALTSAFLSALHVRSTKSPALISFRAETAFPCTGNVMVPGRLADALVEAASFTVIVLELASTDTTSAPFTDASFFLSDLSSALASTLDSSVMRAGSEAVPFSFVLSCWAAAVPATRTKPSSRVSFFMFPPVGVRYPGQ
jgi:hypothetical protein